MPSPFPGMDPYFEGELWRTFHTELGVEIAHQLTPLLAPRYIARAEKRFVVENPDDLTVELEEIVPDVGVRKVGEGKQTESQSLQASAPLEVATVIPRKVPHVWVAIRDPVHRKLVTAIEFLSPANKRGRGRKDYLRKRGRVLRSEVHLLEMDLIRKGQRPPMRKKLPSVPYFVFLSRAERRPIVEVWPIALDQPLPKVPVPLLSGDADVFLDLQQAFTSVYDASRYDLEIDYSRPPDVALPEELQSWVKNLLDKRGR